MLKRSFLFVAAIAATVTGLSSAAQAQAARQAGPVQAGPWTLLADHTPAVLAGEAWVRPGRYAAARLDQAGMRRALADAPMEVAPGAGVGEGLPLELPHPAGGVTLFLVAEAPVMEPALQAQFPEIRTYIGQGVANPAETLRMDMTPAGFHAQVLSPDGAWYIDPVTRNDADHYASYYKRDLRRGVGNWGCLTPEPDEAWVPPAGGVENIGTTLRTYRLAVSTTGEYGAFHGGTVGSALGAVVTVVNRVTGVYETDLGVRLTLVATNNAVIFVNASTDPYTNPGSPGATNNTLQTTLDSTIGAANYDVGHVLHRGGGFAGNGLAGGIGTVCAGGVKGKGYSSKDPPVGDPFAVDYVAHELGHQFGGRHSFNNCSGGPGDAEAIAHEPASGSTIMGYAGICGNNDLQPNSDAMFASINLEQMHGFVSGTACAVTQATGNTEPVVNAGPDRTIPAGTPFDLTAVASDADGDALTYSWEQRNGGPAVPLTGFSDNGQSPIARVFLPVTSPTRTLPRTANLLGNTFFLGETLPATTRTLNWRCVVRDNRAGGATANWDDVVLSVTNAAGPFRVTSPASAVSWTGFSTQTVTWNVAGTNTAPVSCANVSILFSTDGGNTWPHVLVGSTPNDGSETITVPYIPTTQGRVRVQAIGNIFFNINQGGLITVVAPSPGADLTVPGPAAFSDSTPNGNNNARIDPGETQIAVTVPVANTGLTAATGVSGTLVSLTPTVTVVQSASAYPDIAGPSGSATNTTPYVISVDASHPCGDPISLRLDVTSNEDAGSGTFSFDTGIPGGPGAPTRIAYTGAPVTVSAGPTDIPLAVSGLSGPIADVDFLIENVGGSCTTPGISHTWISDFELSLASPAGTVVVLFDERGGSGDNMCSTTFDDAAAGPISGGAPPFTGTFRPETVLSAFNGESPNGTWNLRVRDVFPSADAGTVRAFAVRIRTQNPPVCDDPLPGPSCDSIDFNGDTLFPDNQDLEDFFNVFGGGPCSTGTCSDIDFNNDGLFPDNEDLETYLRVFGGGSC